MKIWLKERQERIRVNDETIKGSLKIAKCNQELNIIEKKWVKDAVKDYNEWRKDNKLKPIKLPKWVI